MDLLEGIECLLAELDRKTIKHGILIVPRLLSFDWLELSSPLLLASWIHPDIP